jgi:fumarylacetoacetate (FAA) hydrolase family protein
MHEAEDYTKAVEDRRRLEKRREARFWSATILSLCTLGGTTGLIKHEIRNDGKIDGLTILIGLGAVAGAGVTGTEVMKYRSCNREITLNNQKIQEFRESLNQKIEDLINQSGDEDIGRNGDEPDWIEF